jgi:3-oxoadipate enol-lactonase
MRGVTLNGNVIHFADEGAPGGFPVVFGNSLGTDYRVWDRLLPLLPAGLRLIRFDKRGHGLSEAPKAPYHMGDLVGDAAALMDHLGVKGALFVGLSIGGLIAQGLAAERPDLVRAMVLMDTAAKIGNDEIWNGRIDAIRKGGIAALEESILERWFSKDFRANRKEELACWRAMLCRTTEDGYCGCGAAIRDTDLMESTARLTLPTLAMAGDEDGATPPDLVRETAALIPGARFEVIRGSGHLPCIEKPDVVAGHIASFMKDNGLG